MSGISATVPPEENLGDLEGLIGMMSFGLRGEPIDPKLLGDWKAMQNDNE